MYICARVAIIRSTKHHRIKYIKYWPCSISNGLLQRCRWKFAEYDWNSMLNIFCTTSHTLRGVHVHTIHIIKSTLPSNLAYKFQLHLSLSISMNFSYIQTFSNFIHQCHSHTHPHDSIGNSPCSIGCCCADSSLAEPGIKDVDEILYSTRNRRIRMIIPWRNKIGWY